MKRQNGILMPIFSLPNKYGIGDFGKSAYEFVDFLQSAGQSVWQILPLVQTGYGNSPYSSISAQSVNPYFISPEKLFEQGLITARELNGARLECGLIDYGALYTVRFPLLRKAFERFDKNGIEFKAFIKSKVAYDYALFMSAKEVFEYKPFYEWEEGLKTRDKKALNAFAKANVDKVLFWQFVQFMARTQWFELKAYANSKGIKIMGDMPLYVALDSVDVWKNPNLFKLDQNFVPKKVAGVPPDYFCQDGQLWGNPVYDYAEHEKDGFKWWAQRVANMVKLYDLVRIDHFRALDRYYEIPAEATNAREGEWINVPSDQLFSAIFKKVKKDKIVAEDLGIIDDGVRDLLKKQGLPGMKILSFAFDGQADNLYLPQNICKNSVCYTGTHDNDTLMGLINRANGWDYRNLLNGVENSAKLMGVRCKIKDARSLAKTIIKLGFACKANLFIIPLQDALFLDSEYRVNEPGTVKQSNWSVRIDKKLISQRLSSTLKGLTSEYDRL